MKKSLSLLLSLVFAILMWLAATMPASAETVPFGSRTLSMGMSGTDVEQLQTYLTDLGYYYRRISGYFDKKTRNGVISFQNANRLPADGVVNQDDYDKINQLINPEPPPPPPPPEPPAPPPGGTLYVIQPGDTFYTIALSFNVSVESLIAANPGVDPNNLQVGQTIVIPAPPEPPPPPPEPPAPPPGGTLYVIQPGDTFYTIALSFNVSVESLIAANPGVDPNNLQVGQTIVIPAPPEPPPPPPPPAPLRHVLGYYTVDYPGDVDSFNSLNAYGNRINSIATFTFLVDGSGNVTGTTPRDGVDAAASKGITPLALIHNYRGGSFNATDAHNLLSSSANRQKLIQNMISILKTEGYKGVNIDLENVPPSDRSCYSALLQEFKSALEPLGFLTTVSIPAKTADLPTAAWSGAFDYAAIGASADWVQIMTYDEHWFGGTPGPIASLPWVENVIKYAVSVIPKEKILLGIPTYGYDWTSSTTSIVNYKSVGSLINNYNVQPQWDSTTGAPYFYYYAGRVKHEVWYENADSARLKFDLVNKYGLMGIGIWHLGYEDGTFWQAVAEKLN
ncbi:MAG: glycosyl hydrolase family 18 protein [Bacillota bacterium]